MTDREMGEVKFLSAPHVELVDSMASDRAVVEAARVSVKGLDAIPSGDTHGLIVHLMKNRHGSPFEHTALKFRIHAPIFVHREFMTHRHISKNTESARYRTMEPVFWVPSDDRPLRQEGKPAEYRLVPGTTLDRWITSDVIQQSSQASWDAYETLLARGIAREVARAVLPVNIYTSWYATMNSRALMHFLSLRVDHPDNSIETRPLSEIQEVAEKMEWLWAEIMPITWRAWHENGRVAP